ncbi:MAG: phosphonatase-like hydrolase [candidate division KSB1 bacterium]|nr:phosphonatase-like hydrolase [candidate division KSB1 bacterium]MDZ7274704.1 phosphonatase-like hydrolase [candidate division KSB1 bacterium]MDZ7285529.1 phosphonatase-like hydrolase [candidate division KSB1 bacterium]MDZ7298561.1 phosphonatase-like hydrolase [candidate division KSB1 bacterium]MDZ7306587.1 phosphonatase-like hydrolase [candidate division KSB1 bacterium]
MNQIQLVVFDIAGTTVADDGHVVRAFQAALRPHGIVLDESALRPWRGAAKHAVLQHFIAEKYGATAAAIPGLVQAAAAGFRAQLEQSFREGGVHPIAGTEQTFAWLREHRIKIALTTGFDRKLTNLILAQLGWGDSLLAAVVCSEEVAQGRPAPYMIFRAMETAGVPDVRQVMVVGDTVLDLEAGANAGVAAVVGVLSGAQGLAQLGKAAHTHLLASVAELPALLAGQAKRC